MTDFNRFLNQLPGSVRRRVTALWADLSMTGTEEWNALLRYIPGMTFVQNAAGTVLEQYKPIVGDKSAVAFVGPKNSGKTTLYRGLLRGWLANANINIGEASPLEDDPLNIPAQAGVFTLLDFPVSISPTGAVAMAELEIFRSAIEHADLLVLVLDASRPLWQTEQEWCVQLRLYKKPLLVALNKTDLLTRPEKQIIEAGSINALKLSPDQIIHTSAVDGEGVDQLISAMARLEPGLLGALGSLLPLYRVRLAWQRIVPAAAGAAVVGLVPLPVVDIIPLLGIQAGLVLSIARIYGYEISMDRAKELIVTFGVGFAGRTLVRELARLGSAPGWVISGAIAAATTLTIGYASILWFGYNQKPSEHDLKEMVAHWTEYFKERIKARRDKPQK